MTGLIIHPLRIRALDRMKVLRVPFDPQPFSQYDYVHQFESGRWGFFNEEMKGAVALDGKGWKPPYAPGDYFVKEVFRVSWCAGSKARGYLVGVEYKSTWDGHRDPHGKVFSLPEMHYCGKLTKNGTGAWQSPLTMPEKFARYLITIGPPVPCRLGEVDVVQQRDEGVIIDIGDEYRRTWDALYPRHPYSPDLWTWGYPMEVRRR